ncbi:MAG: peptidoglycan editing factor PgeF [Clostridia bacterium]|nr:peptidoglycan editing factor PgeF [Clostridia bacterium]
MFNINNKDGVVYYTSQMLEKTGLVRHGISTRKGGVSCGCYSSLNLRWNCEDNSENVKENYARFARAVGADPHDLVLSKQVHEDVIKRISYKQRGNGIFVPNEFDSADGLITCEPGIALVTLYADCVPLLFLDPVKRVVASIHSGWRGTVKRIGAKTVALMEKEYGSDPGDVLCAIGPSIRIDNYEVGDEVAAEFIENFGEETVKRYGVRYHVSMQRAIAMQLESAGVRSENIDDCRICTYDMWETFFSHRRTNGRRGNFGAVIELK